MVGSRINQIPNPNVCDLSRKQNGNKEELEAGKKQINRIEEIKYYVDQVSPSTLGIVVEIWTSIQDVRQHIYSLITNLSVS